VAKHIVYEGVAPATGVVKYVSLTSRRLEARQAEHLASDTARNSLRYRPVSGAENLTKTQARV
jgi:hypothetical protein